jgi:hypothetical protein
MLLIDVLRNIIILLVNIHVYINTAASLLMYVVTKYKAVNKFKKSWKHKYSIYAIRLRWV